LRRISEIEIDFYAELSKKRETWLENNLKLEEKYRNEAFKSSKLETENAQLRAQNEVLSKIELKEDEYRDKINDLQNKVDVLESEK
jgi:hypothetical protein